ncbi:MAG TPA: ion channel [Nocardioides sp.]|nr:ion channel [Nocardioides sp.]
MSRPLRFIVEHPSGMLLGAQLLQVLLWPFLDDSVVGRAGLGAIGMLAVGAAVLAVRRTPMASRVILVLGAPAMLLTLVEPVFADEDAVVLLSGLLHAPFYFYVSYAMLRYLLHDDKVTTDEYFATGAAFTVVAWGFAYAFSIVQVMWPGSFSSGEGAVDQTWFELLYLSFSILTSVGLSDIVAVEAQARSVVMVEMMTGVFYIAMVVARMVGLTILRRR